MDTRRAYVLIDGSNLFHRLKEVGLNHLSQFDFRAFSDWLAGGRPVATYRYYTGVVRARANDPDGQRLRSKQQRLFSHLESPGQTFLIRRGEIRNTGGDYHEKGVDVQIATDLLVGAYEEAYDTAILISSDSDLVPAIRKVRELGKEVVYVGFSHRPTFALQKYASLTRLLLKEDLERFERQPQLPGTK